MNKKIIFYYLLLLALFLSWQDPVSLPGPVMRIAYLVAFIVPVYFLDKKLLPIIVALFLTLTTHGYSTSYMPAVLTTYIITLGAGLLVLRQPLRETPAAKKIIIILIMMLIYVTVRNLFDANESFQITNALLLTIIILYYVDFSDRTQLHELSNAFAAAALILSVLLLINRGVYVSEYGTFERVGFNDINYSACVVSLGVVVSMVELFSRDNSKNKGDAISKVLYISTIIVSLFALALNASRGSLLSIAVPFVVLLFFSKANGMYKFLGLALIVALIVYMYNNSYFELLEARIMEEDGTGTHRTEIWINKLEAFAACNPIEWLFRLGYQGGRNLAIDKIIVPAFHNDFLAMLVEYGFIGFITFIYFLTKPLRILRSYKSKLPGTLAMFLGLSIICFTLEPFAAGRLPYYMFMIYLVLYAKS